MLKLTQMIFFILNSLLAITGVTISWKIFLKKKSSEKFVCYIGESCGDVLSSKFSKFLGINIERIGFVYYSVLFLASFYLSVFKPIPELIFGLFIVSFVGFAFSIYLTLAQAFYLKKWCPWCFASATITTLIFGLSTMAFSNYVGVVAFNLAEILNILNSLHLIGIAIGVSAATISCLLIINFLKDFKIDSHEDKKLTILDQIIWLSVVILLVVNLCYYIIDPVLYFNSSQLLTQFVIFVVLILNNILLSLYVNPKLIGMRIDMKSIHVFRTFWLRQLALAMGVISVVSWYAILFTSFFVKISGNDLATIISYYIAINIILIAISQFVILLVDKIKFTSDNIYRFK